jgi:hypothetical protein
MHTASGRAFPRRARIDVRLLLQKRVRPDWEMGLLIDVVPVSLVIGKSYSYHPIEC